MFALYNIVTKKFYVLENQYSNCVEANTFIEACTFKEKKDALYKNDLLKPNYIVIDFEQAKQMNRLV